MINVAWRKKKKKTCINLGGRRGYPDILRRKKHKRVYTIVPAGLEAPFKQRIASLAYSDRPLQEKLGTTNSTMPCLDAPPLVKKMSSLTITTSTMPCLDAPPLKMSSPHDVTTTTTTMPQSPSSVAELSSDQA